MADFTLYDEGDEVAFLPSLEKDRLIDMQMYLSLHGSKCLHEREEFLLTFKYEDVVLLRDYLSSVIGLFEKQGMSDK
ncbi:MAG: hypothetical protein B6D44_00235 [Ignavibacteriales bacterium UTCHB2]|jgi:hypothetical protein|nr:MAG: hypothetical protein B6D44_00235 [Ignavibacteriales bacterium UTCHB2]